MMEGACPITGRAHHTKDSGVGNRGPEIWSGIKQHKVSLYQLVTSKAIASNNLLRKK